jgi:hypothetical protein
MASRPGVSVGDVRSGSVKRVVSALGEGSVCVHLTHRGSASFEPKEVRAGSSAG